MRLATEEGRAPWEGGTQSFRSGCGESWCALPGKASNPGEGWQCSHSLAGQAGDQLPHSVDLHVLLLVTSIAYFMLCGRHDAQQIQI